MEHARTNGRRIVEAMHDPPPHELCEYVHSYVIPRSVEQNMSDVFSMDSPEIVSNGGLYDEFNFNLRNLRLLNPLAPLSLPPHVENRHAANYIKPDSYIFR
jgi:hypothetical protein